MQEELKEMQKDIIIVSKNYNNELRIFQKGNIIDSMNAQKVKEKFDELKEANRKLESKQTDIDRLSSEIQEYLVAMNGMAIRYTHNYQGLNQPMIFDLETDTYGETKIKITKED